MYTNNTIIKMVFDRWYALIKNCDTILDAITDEQLQKEIAPNRNRGTYLLGHLIAVHDDMLPLLGLGERQYPELTEPFIKSADKVVTQVPSAATLRAIWTKQCELLKQKFEAVKAEEWFEKHTAVSAEDFMNEPHRNKLNIILTRTTHLAYHTGLLALLK